MGKYMLGIDLGTQSIRTHLYDEHATCIATASRPQYVDTPRPDWVTQKASVWWEIIKENIASILAQTNVSPRDIVSIGCCGHMHGPVAAAAGRKTVMDDTQLYSDRRTANLSELLKQRANYRDIYNLTANPPAPSWFGIKIKWLKDNMPEVYEQTDTFLPPKDYINYMLTGEACTDPSEASGSYLMDRATDNWSDTLIENLGICKDKLPTIKKSYEAIGTVCREAAAETGLCEKTLVVCGGGDMLCALFTSGLDKTGNIVDINGTGSIFCYYSKTPILDDRIMNLRHVIDGFVPFGNTDSSGGSLRWLRDNLAKEETRWAKEMGMDEYDYLCQKGQETKAGADGLLFMPYMVGERTLGSQHSKGSFVGLSLSTTVGHMVRALMEGVAMEFRRTLDIFYQSGAQIKQVFHVSGGSKGALWNQIKADIYGLPVYTLKVDEGGVLGAALLGGVAAGLFASPKQATEHVLQIDREFLPNPKLKHFYSDLYAVFCETHDALQQPYIHLAKLRE